MHINMHLCTLYTHNIAPELNINVLIFCFSTFTFLIFAYFFIKRLHFI